MDEEVRNGQQDQNNAPNPDVEETKDEEQEVPEETSGEVSDDTAKTNDDEYHNMTVDPTVDKDQAAEIQRLRKKIEEIQESVKKTGKYYDKENEEELDLKKANKKIKKLEDEIAKAKGYPWFERDSNNIFEAIAKAIIRTIAYMISGEYRKAKDNALDREDDAIRQQMDIKLTNIKRVSEKELSDYLQGRDKENEKGKDNKEFGFADEPPKSNKNNNGKGEEDILNSKTGSTAQEPKQPSQPSQQGKEQNAQDGLDEAMEKAAANAQGKKENETKSRKTEKEWIESRKAEVLYRRNRYCLNEKGKDFKDLSDNEKAEINAKYLLLCEDSKFTANPANEMEYLEPEITSNKEFRKIFQDLYGQMLGTPVNEEYVERRIAKDVPYYFASFINKEPENTAEEIDRKNAMIAQTMCHNPYVLEYIPKEYVEKNLSDIIDKLRDGLTKEYDKDVEVLKSINKETDKFPKPSERIDSIKRAAEHRDMMINDGAYEPEDKSNIYKDVVNELVMSYFVDYIQGENIKFHGESEQEHDRKENNIVYSRIVTHNEMKEIISNNISNRPDAIEKDQQDLKNTMEKLEKEMDVETDPHRKTWLESQRRIMADFGETLNELEKAYKEQETEKSEPETRDKAVEPEPTPSEPEPVQQAETEKEDDSMLPHTDDAENEPSSGKVEQQTFDEATEGLDSNTQSAGNNDKTQDDPTQDTRENDTGDER